MPKKRRGGGISIHMLGRKEGRGSQPTMKRGEKGEIRGKRI